MLGSETLISGARARVGGVNRFVRAEFGSRINSKKNNRRVNTTVIFAREKVRFSRIVMDNCERNLRKT